MGHAEDEFVHRSNVAHFHRQLALTEEVSQRAMLMALLAEELAKGMASGWAPPLGAAEPRSPHSAPAPVLIPPGRAT